MLGSICGQLKKELLFPHSGMWSPWWDTQPLVVFQPVWAHTCLNLPVCSPGFHQRCAWGRGGCCWAARSYIGGKGKICWCGLYGVLGRTGRIVGKASSWYCLGNLYIWHLRDRIHGKMGFILILIVSESVSFQMENTATQLEEQW